MQRLRWIAAQEWRDGQRSGRGWLTAAVPLVLLFAGVLAGWQQHQRSRAEQQEAAVAERAVWLAQPAKNPHAAAHHGFFVFQPPSPLGPFDPGVAEYVGQTRYLEPHGETLPRFTPAEDRVPMRGLPVLTPAGTLQLVVPLMLVLLLHAIVAGERETGRLGLILSQGVAPRVLVIGKAIGGTMPAWFAVAGGVICLGGLILVSAERHTVSDLLARAIGLTLVHAAWIVICACLLTAVSIAAVASRRALVAGLVVWVIGTLLMPLAVMQVVAKVAPAPTPLEFLTAFRKANQARPSYWDDLVPAATARLLVQYGVTRAEDLPVSPATIAQLDQEDDDTVRVGRVFEELRAVHVAQERWMAGLAWMAPLVSVRELSSALAGTDAWHARTFGVAAEAYRRRVIRQLNEDELRLNSGDFLKSGVRYEAGAPLWASVPAFAYVPPGAAEVLNANWGHVAVVGAWLVVSLGWVCLAAARIRVA